MIYLDRYDYTPLPFYMRKHVLIGNSTFNSLQGKKSEQTLIYLLLLLQAWVEK